MYNFLSWLLKTREGPLEIAFLSFFHILYLVIIVSLTIALAYYLNKHEDKKKPALRLLAYALVALYVSDFFLQPFVSSDFTMNIDKLPFHICTVLCPVVAFTEFNAKFDKIKEPVAFLAIVAPLMYLVYPGNAIGDISPFCYKILQTFIYHGVLFCWGLNTLASGQFVPNIRNWYKSLIGICMIAAWATVGNLTFNSSYLGNDPDAHHYDWFFLTGTTFPFVPPYLMPLAVIAAVLGMVMIIYGLYYLYMHLYSKRSAKAEIKEEMKNEYEYQA